ncbi:MAG: hypothetical protein IJP88_02365, partial [Synergistaceae bacterium]|nr:hypothetical protein [Synergistaceae bacterium]
MLINVQGENMNSKPEQSGLNTAESGAIHSQNDAEAHLKERKTEQQKFKRAQNVKHVSLANALFAMLPRRGRGLPHMKPRHSKGVLESAIEEAADQQDVLINEEVIHESVPDTLEAVELVQEPEAAPELESETKTEIKVDEVEAEPEAEEPTPEVETTELEEVTEEMPEQPQEFEPVQLQELEAAPELEAETEIKVDEVEADEPTLEAVELVEISEEEPEQEQDLEPVQVQEPEAAPELETETEIKVEDEQTDEPTLETVELEEVAEELQEQ